MNQTFNSGIRAKYDRGIRRDDASCDVIVRGIIPGSPISRNLLNILEENERNFEQNDANNAKILPQDFFACEKGTILIIFELFFGECRHFISHLFY